MTQTQKRSGFRTNMLSRAAFLGLGLAFAGVPLATPAQTPSPASNFSLAANQQNFASAHDAVAALVKALQADDKKSLLEIFGPGGEKLVASGDSVADTAAREKFLALYNESHMLVPEPDGSVTLVIGNSDWPMPIPIIHVADRWQFDATVGAQDIIDRRIGRNELLTIQTMLSAVAAEEDYFERMKAANGTGVYAERQDSTPGKHDGLYWDVAAGGDESPLAPLVDKAEDEGYPGAYPGGVQSPYHGYYFHLLKAQGPDASQGESNYIHDGKMTGGFAFIAWPANYAATGIMTFIVNQDGNVFQKDLGPETRKTGSNITMFNPDLSWTLVNVSN